jgi:hypothetical protein
MPYLRGAIDLDLAFDMMPWWNELAVEPHLMGVGLLGA